MNALKPELMSSEERLDEIAKILAAGVMRLKARQSRQLSARSRESSVDFTSRQSRHDLAEDAEVTDGVLARLAQIRTMDIVALKDLWKELFQAEAPPYNRKFLESRSPTAFKNWPMAGSSPRR